VLRFAEGKSTKLFSGLDRLPWRESYLYMAANHRFPVTSDQ